MPKMFQNEREVPQGPDGRSKQVSLLPNVSHAQTQDLFHLELDGTLQVGDLIVNVVSVRQEGRKLSSLVQPGAQQSGNLLDQRLGSQKGVILLSQLLHKLLLLVQFLQVVGTHVRQTFSLGLVTMLLISEDANGKLGSGHMAQLDGAGETLVLLGIVVLQTNLQVDSLDKFALLGVLGVG